MSIELPSFAPLSPEGVRAADLTCEFLEILPQSKGRRWYGEPLQLLDWQRVYLRELFGRRDPATGLRRYRKAFIFIPKKQGKSTVAAGLTLKLTIADQEPGAECYGAAYDKDQAKIVFDVAQAMVEQHPELARRCKVVKHESRIEFPETRSWYRAMAHDTQGSHGFNIHGLVIDEFHTWKDGELYRSLDHGTASRDQPLTIIITTAGVFDPESPCWKLYDYACKVRDGILDDPTFLPVIFEAPADADWKDPAVWAMANPGLGVTVPLAYLEMKAREAENMPSELLAFRQLHLNQWPEQLEGWLPMERWKACGTLPMNEDDLRGRKAWLGLDLASTRDLTAISVIIPLDDGTIATPMRFFCPDETIIERSKNDGVQYTRWANEGWIKKTQGNATDYAAVRKEIHELASKFEIQEIAPDPWNAQDLNAQLMADGFKVVSIPQTMGHVSYPAKELEKRVARKQLRHGNNPVLTWCASNATIRQDSNENIKPDKKRSKERIDGITAVVNGFARALAEQHDKPRWLLSTGA